jgi:magnesium transporter
MTKYYKLQGGRIVFAEEREAQIVVLVSPEQEEISDLIKNLEIDEHTLSSAFDSDELARVEQEDDHIAIIYKYPKNYSASEHFQFRVASAGIFLFKDFVIVISDSELSFTDEKKFSKLGSLKTFVLKLLNLSIVHFNEHLRIINRMCNELEEKHVYKLKKTEYLIVFGLSKSLVYYENAISSNEVLFRKMQLSKSFKFNENEQEILDDIIIESSQCKRLTEIYSSVLANMMASHEVSHESSTSGDIGALKTLTILSVVIMMPTAVTSMFSMNVLYPFNAESPIAFWLIFCSLIAIIVSFWWWQNKNKW